jgi:8-oxo-dGTP pyrophosphatase MutT (NUDIX family)
MSAPAPDDSEFSPEAFFRRAAARLDPEPQAGVDEPFGDHLLNPGFVNHDATYRDAAVLIPVVAREPRASVILTERTKHLAAHAGQVAFPGGKIDPADATPAAAAIREAGEEIGLDPAVIRPIGYLAPYLTRTGFRVVPVVARVEPVHMLTLNPNEVDEAFEVPLSFLMNPGNFHQGSREFFGKMRYFYEIPFENRYIWGVTAGIIRGLYERMFG